MTGGRRHSGYSGSLDSTEVLESKTGPWRPTAKLPAARDGLRAASVDNNIFVFGENFLFDINIEHLIMFKITFSGGHGGKRLKKILRYNKNHTWEDVGQMKEARNDHAVGVLEDVSQLCS